MEGIVNEGNGGSPQTDEGHYQQQQQILQLLKKKMGSKTPMMSGVPSIQGEESQAGMNPYGFSPQPTPLK